MSRTPSRGCFFRSALASRFQRAQHALSPQSKRLKRILWRRCVMNDLKFAFRQLLKNPGFTAVAVLTLALGIGANLALFAILNELLLRPKPVANPDELWAIEPADSIGQPLFPNVCRPYYEAVRQHARVFKGIIGYAGIMPKLRSKE